MTTAAQEPEVVPLASFRRDLAEIISNVGYAHDRKTISKNGKPLAAIVPVEDLERLRQYELAEDRSLLAQAIADDEDGGVPYRELRKRLSQ